MLAKIPSGRFADMAELLGEVRALQARGFDDIADRIVRSTDTTLMLEKTWIENAVRKKRSGLKKFLRKASIAAGLGVMALGGWYFADNDSVPVTSRDGTDTSELTQMASPSPVAAPDTDIDVRAPASAATTKSSPQPTPVAAITSKPEPTPAKTPSRTAKTSTRKPTATKASTPPKPRKQTVAKRAPKPRATAPQKSARQREIEYLSRLARQRLQQGKLDAPFGDNAVFYRDELVRVAPRSAVSARISYDIAERYRRRAEHEIATGQFLAAKDSIDDGLRVRPDHKRLRDLKENRISEYSKGFFGSAFDDFKRSFNETEPGSLRSNPPGQDR
jgi:hypothetical protein